MVAAAFSGTCDAEQIHVSKKYKPNDLSRERSYKSNDVKKYDLNYQKSPLLHKHKSIYHVTQRSQSPHRTKDTFGRLVCY